jgi:CheY-like chemotaxis protein
MTMKKIIVVEDEILIAMDIKRRLEEYGYEVPDMVFSGEEAVQRTKEIRPDLVLMDISLRGKMNGIEAAKQIGSQFHIPVIFITAHTDEETFRSLQEITHFGCITKPLDELELRDKIEKVFSIVPGESMHQ